MDFQAGEILCFNKPLGWTSFKLVNDVRFSLCRGLKMKKLKVGHAGTLDPLATGVMIVCTGRATKRIEEFQYQTKEYVATMELGATTPSFDMEKPIDKTYDYSHVTEALVRETLQGFVGTIEQVPPSFSACKIQGKRAYEYAREGEAIDLKPKTLVIDEIELTDYQEASSDRRPRITVRVVCSKGTYIRALARDIGEALHCGAYLTALERTRVGDYRLSDCLDIVAFRQEYLGRLTPSLDNNQRIIS
ncbi:MAG: tRNA pseudouridine(55) synthase TruB [Bacteroidales bacterium]|nr:tRNA pseudouridine(55) synthase TruB [Bacteroidales bacterium]